MIKLLFVSMSMFLLFGCTNVQEEMKDEQVARLLKVSERKMEEERRIKQQEIKTQETEEKKAATQSEEPIQPEEKKVKVDPHAGKTNGEIMVYEMEKISSEMGVLQAEVERYKQTREQLKLYREKLDHLERKNNAGLNE